MPLPDEISFEQGATLMCASATAFHALRKSRLQAGERVAVFGAGGLGWELIVCVLGSRNHFRDAGRLRLDYGFQAEKERHFARSDVGISLSDAAPAADTRGFALQAASFSDYGMAADLHAALTSRNYPSFIETVLLDNDKTSGTGSRSDITRNGRAPEKPGTSSSGSSISIRSYFPVSSCSSQPGGRLYRRSPVADFP